MKLNIRLKLLIGFAILLILSSLVQGLSFFITRQYTSSQTSTFLEVQAKKGSNEIVDFFTRLSTNSFGIAKVYKGDRDNLPQTANYVIKNNSYIKKITILSPAGHELAKFDSFGQIPDDALSYEVLSDPFKSATGGSTAISKVYYVEKDLGPHVDLFSPIFGEKNDVIGAVKMQINLDQLRTELASIKLGENGYIYIVDNEGRLIEHPSQQFVLQRPNLSSRKVISDIMANSIVTPKDEEYANEKNIRVVAKAVKIPGYNWIAVFEQPKAEAFGFLTFIRNLFIVTIIGSTFVLLLISIFLSENLTRPIRKLQQIAHQIQMEKGKVKRTMVITSGDEIESLSYSFASLVDQLLVEERSLETTSSQLKVVNNKLQELDQLKDDFVSVTSHELRTPMTAIRSYAWMALHRSDQSLTDKQKKYLVRVLISSERLINLVNDLLNISRIESGRIEINPEPVDMIALVKDVIDEVYYSKSMERNFQFTVMEKPIPKVFADPDKLRQILLNLVGNSLKFTPEGGKIVFDFFTDGKVLETSVKDSGVGISKDDLGRLFHKFSRLDNSYTAISTSGGTGLGLYISKSLIELMHGKIWARSEGLGRGTTFTFSMPVAAGEVLANAEKYKVKAKGEAKGLEAVAL